MTSQPNGRRCARLGFLSLILTVAFTVNTAIATTVRFETSEGNFDVRLFDETAAGTVANFLNYVESGRYAETLVHRTVNEFVVQGGGFATDFSPVAVDPPIVNEPGASNLRGTIAMAKTSNPDSATSQWFVNVADNTFLDNPANSGGFTVFGEVVGDGMAVVDAISALSVAGFAAPFAELPLVDPSGGSSIDNLVVVNQVVAVPEPASWVLTFVGFVGMGIFRMRMTR